MFRPILSLISRVSVRHALLGLVLAALVGGLAVRNSDVLPPDEESRTEPTLPVVSLTTAASYGDTASASIIGTARAVSEAAITPERSGRVGSVNVGLGDFVSAGTIIARLENRAEQAAVLQAEGAYEAALASAAQSGVGVNEAENALVSARREAVSAYQTAYTTANNIVRNSIDQFFANPQGQIPGLRVSGRGYTQELNERRVDLATLLPGWQADAQTLTVDDDLPAALGTAEERTRDVLAMVDIFITIFEDQQTSSSRYTDTELRAFGETFAGHRNTLLSTISTIEQRETALMNAQEALTKARLGGEVGAGSAADAQVKQALGSLRAAQASLEDTLLRTPIAGTVNSLDVRTGDFVSANTPLASVANNQALEIVTFVASRERERFSLGSEVTLATGGTGVVSAVAPAVDPETGKREVRILTESTSVSAGDTVTLSAADTTATSSPGPLRVPLTAVKFESENGYVLVLSDDVLERRDVELGTVSGDTVEVVGGLDTTTEFVADARGLNAGDAVAVSGE